MALPDNHTAPVRPTRPHPHPLRSHSSESIYQIRDVKSDQPESSLLNSTNDAPYRQHRRSRSVHGIDRSSFASIPALPAFPPQVAAPSTERFDNAAILEPTQGSKDFPVVPVRPPLRPTISFGGETRMSYASITSIEEKSKEIAVAEHQRRQKQQILAVSSWRSCASFAILCLLSLFNGMATTSLATVLPVRHELCERPKQV